jgi:hypothetical protein
MPRHPEQRRRTGMASIIEAIAAAEVGSAEGAGAKVAIATDPAAMVGR